MEFANAHTLTRTYTRTLNRTGYFNSSITMPSDSSLYLNINCLTSVDCVPVYVCVCRWCQINVPVRLYIHVCIDITCIMNAIGQKTFHNSLCQPLNVECDMAITISLWLQS